MQAVRINVARAFMTEFDGQQDCGKVFEKGAEVAWTAPSSSEYRKSNWWTRFHDQESVKETTFVETD